MHSVCWCLPVPRPEEGILSYVATVGAGSLLLCEVSGFFSAAFAVFFYRISLACDYRSPLQSSPCGGDAADCEILVPRVYRIHQEILSDPIKILF